MSVPTQREMTASNAYVASTTFQTQTVVDHMDGKILAWSIHNRRKPTSHLLPCMPHDHNLADPERPNDTSLCDCMFKNSLYLNMLLRKDAMQFTCFSVASMISRIYHSCKNETKHVMKKDHVVKSNTLCVGNRV